MNRIDAEKKLKELFKIDHFYDEQWNAIEKLLNGERVLMIQRTGFGKSLVYQFVATVREGTTIIFSPLIALMRDQVNKLRALGIKAAFVNSTLSEEEKADILEKAKKGYYKMLYIAPERQKDVEWLDTVKQLRLSMVVVDEAHCISIWGHDFRPDYRKIVDVVKQLQVNFPVLACTATVTLKVQADITEQLDNRKLTVIRGDLSKSNFSLSVFFADSQEAKMESILKEIQSIQGTGIIYTGTKVEAEIYSTWLEFNKINAAYYHAGLDDATRYKIEEGLMQNRYKCVVSTNALGMGIDKPDIRFVFHTQVPTSPLHYYQEIGRAGRDGNPSKVVLYFSAEDETLPLSFIKNSRPEEADYNRVIYVLKQDQKGLHSIIKAVNMKKTKVLVILEDLLDQKIIEKNITGNRTYYAYRFNAPALDTKPFEELRKAKTKDWACMREYIELDKNLCRMKYLRTYLGDISQNICGKCDNDLGISPIKITASTESLELIEKYRETFFPKLEIATAKSILLDGVAASYYGVSNVGAVLKRCKYETKQDFPDHLLILTLKAYRNHYKQKKFDLILYVPPTKSGDLVKNFSHKIAKILKFNISDDLQKTRVTKEQKIFESAISKEENLKDAFDISISVQGKSILLIDDIYDSGQTIKTIGKLLQQKGAIEVGPLVIAKTVGGR